LPWQAQPFPVPEDTLQAAVRGCRAPNGGLIPLASTLILADIRGGDRIVLLYVGPRVESYTCVAVQSVNGRFEMGSTAGGDRRSPDGPLVPGEVRPEPIQAVGTDPANGRQATTISIATGRIGKAIAGLDLLLGSGTTIRTTSGNGWYAAWWPTDDPVAGYQARSLDGSPYGTPIIPSGRP
jgi:hypothetical protein